ncbi:MAG: RNA polymerase sigma factor [Rhizobiales bacterium]|nr:RNA polymerase sigma factor [Hyphomicrobiales bacterium]
MDDFEKNLLQLLPNLRRYALSLSASPSEAEDLLHDCLEKAFANKSKWRGGSIKSWAMTIMTNQFRNKLRKKTSQPLIVPIEGENIVANDAMSDPLEWDKIIAAIDQLSEDNRAVLMLVVVENYSYIEISKMLNIPMGTVMSRLSRARNMIAQILDGHNIISFRRPS